MATLAICWADRARRGPTDGRKGGGLMAAGIFSAWQPKYADQNVITFPVGKDKKPAIKHWQRMGLEGSAQLAW